MTRKKYIKLVMSRGFSRNTARAVAAAVVRDNISVSGINQQMKWLGIDKRVPCISYQFDYDHYIAVISEVQELIL